MYSQMYSIMHSIMFSYIRSLKLRIIWKVTKGKKLVVVSDIIGSHSKFI